MWRNENDPLSWRLLHCNIFPQVSYVQAFLFEHNITLWIGTFFFFFFFCFSNSATIFRLLLFSEVIKELPQRCNSEQTEERSVREQTLSQRELGLINFPSIALPPLDSWAASRSAVSMWLQSRDGPLAAQRLGNVNLGQIHQVETQWISARLGCFLRRSLTLQRGARAKKKEKRRQMQWHGSLFQCLYCFLCRVRRHFHWKWPKRVLFIALDAEYMEIHSGGSCTSIFFFHFGSF